jgi:hypothetical protein
VDHCCQNYRDIHSYTPKMRPFPYTFVVFLSWPFRDVNKIFLHVLRGIQGLSKAEMTFVGQFTCSRSFSILPETAFASWSMQGQRYRGVKSDFISPIPTA